jgi:hypothetical protein
MSTMVKVAMLATAITEDTAPRDMSVPGFAPNGCTVLFEEGELVCRPRACPCTGV